MEVDCSKLILNFIGDKEKSIFSGYKVLDKIYDFDTNEIIIPDKLFGLFKEKKLIEFQLILNEESNKKRKNLSKLINLILILVYIKHIVLLIILVR